MLTDEQITRSLQSAGCAGVVRMSFESGPYCIDRPTIKASRFAEQIESAATAPLLARIAELERQMDVMAKNTEAQAHASLQREIELTEKVEKLEQQLEEARKDAERVDWLDNNVFAKDPDEWDQKYGRCRDGKTQMWAIFAPKCVQGSARRIIDAAIKEQT